MIKKRSKPKAEPAPFPMDHYALTGARNLTASGSISRPAFDAALQRVIEIGEKMADSGERSEVAAINRSAGHTAVPVSSDTFFVIKKALQYAQQTGGCFDVTVDHLHLLWREARQSGRTPGGSEVGRLLHLVNYKDVICGTGCFNIRLNYFGQSISLESLAVGYAADEVRKAFEKHGVGRACVHFGESVSATIGNGESSFTEDGLWNIPVRHFGLSGAPVIGTITGGDLCVATAGADGGEFLLDGKRCPGVIDPKTGYPVQSGLRSVTVAASSCLDAVILSRTALTLGLEAGKAMIENTPGSGAAFLTDEGFVCVTDSLKPGFTLTDAPIRVEG